MLTGSSTAISAHCNLWQLSKLTPMGVFHFSVSGKSPPEFPASEFPAFFPAFCSPPPGTTSPPSVKSSPPTLKNSPPASANSPPGSLMSLHAPAPPYSFKCKKKKENELYIFIVNG